MKWNARWECRLVLIEPVMLELLANKTEEARFRKKKKKKTRIERD
jgi:hypothetical protein